MAQAMSAGVDPPSIWDWTYRELYALFDGHNRRARHDGRMAILTGFTAGSVGRAKKIDQPLLRRLLRPWEEAREPMSDKALRAAIIAANRAMGGKVTYRTKAKPGD